MRESNFDFSGWATKFDRRCSDGRTIRDGAFDDDDGKQVPLIFQHIHDSPNAVLGHALLEKHPGEGIYAYCSFNDTEGAKNAKEAIRHGDITALSIHANRLKQTNSGDVLHGRIREVSLVFTGANPDAIIDEPVLLHMDDMDEDEAMIFSGEGLDNLEALEPIFHADSDDGEEDDDSGDTMEEVWNTLTEKQQTMVYAMLAMATSEKGKEMKQSDYDEEFLEHAEGDDDVTLGDVWDSLNDQQKKLFYAMADMISKSDGEAIHSDEGGIYMRRNVFETDEDIYDGSVYELTHSDFESIVADTRRTGSMRDAFNDFKADKMEELSHSDVVIGEVGDSTYGVANIDWLFPEARNMNMPPEWIKRDTDWVTDVMSSVHHTPFSRIKSMFADITAEEARAKGYTKGKKKTEEVFTLLKRQTSPTTVYKKQKMDRDDRIDITDFDIVAWLKSEMRLMLDEELARAFLVGDGRNNMSDDKIKEDCIRPIWTDDELFTIHHKIDIAADADEDTIANETIRAAIRSRKDYKGSGSLTFYTTEETVINMLLLEDGIGNRKYKTRTELATALGVSKIVVVPVLEGLTREDSDSKTRELVGLMVNMKDYTVGADKGGAVEMFEDFDIDFNQEKYLIETRCSGCLIKPKSAIALEIVRGA